MDDMVDNSPQMFYLCHFPLEPEENPKMFPIAIHVQNIALAEFL